MTPLDVLTAGGVVTPELVIPAADTAGLELAAAAALLVMESMGGHNLWGHDAVSTGGCYVKGATVTAAAYRAYRAAVGAGQIQRQGVGPCQLTDGSLQDQADRLGGCWDPATNLRVGFAHLSALVQTHGVSAGFAAYNGSGPDAQAYAAKAMTLLAFWRAHLATTTEDIMEWSDKAIPDYTKTPAVLLGADVTLGWMATHLGSPGAGQSANVFAELARVEAKLDAIAKKLGA